jgi:xanthine dehydrogenase accessory factor
MLSACNMKSGMTAQATLSNIPKPRRAAWSEDTRDILRLIHDGMAKGLGAALVTIINVEGGSPRGVGAHMAVLSDGRYLGYVSGGCVEAAVAAQAMRMMADGTKDCTIRFGAGSRYMDIKLPCGGAIDLHFCFNPDAGIITEVAARLEQRTSFELGFDTLEIMPPIHQSSGIFDGRFIRTYLPSIRLLLCGNGIEMIALAKLGLSSGYGVQAVVPDADLAAQLTAMGADVTSVKSMTSEVTMAADAWTAIVFLFHDFDWEMKLIPAALASDAFYIGALGSAKTHQTRLSGLSDLGIAPGPLARITGPIGLVPATRDASALAISVLAQIMVRRMG